jgi:cytochrome c oxidase subunit II
MHGEIMKKILTSLILFCGMLVVALSLATITHAQPAPQRIEVTASKFSFSPGEVTVKKDQPVVLVLKSTDVAHGLKISELHVNVTVKAGGTAEVQFTPSQTGDFTGRCSSFCGSGHGSMKFMLHVVG